MHLSENIFKKIYILLLIIVYISFIVYNLYKIFKLPPITQIEWLEDRTNYNVLSPGLRFCPQLESNNEYNLTYFPAASWAPNILLNNIKMETSPSIQCLVFNSNTIYYGYNQLHIGLTFNFSTNNNYLQKRNGGLLIMDIGNQSYMTSKNIVDPYGQRIELLMGKEYTVYYNELLINKLNTGTHRKFEIAPFVPGPTYDLYVNNTFQTTIGLDHHYHRYKLLQKKKVIHGWIFYNLSYL
jgi:hypothetical protein